LLIGVYSFDVLFISENVHIITSDLRKANKEVEAYEIQSGFKFTSYKTPIGFGGGK